MTAVRMLPEDMQLANEYTYSRKFIDTYIDKEIREHPETEAKVMHGVELLEQYRSTTYSYNSKNDRIAQLQDLDLEELVRGIFTGIAYCQLPELLTSVTAQLAGRLQFDDKRDSILTVAEMVAVLCQTDAFDIIKPAKYDSLMILSQIPLSEKLLKYIEQSCYLPPMVCEPKELTSNFESGYLTHNDCVILGKHNGHSEDICLDVINKQNAIPLRLDTDFLSRVEEVPTFDLDTPEKMREWGKFKRLSHELYLLIAKRGNKFWLTNKVDKRLRLYAQGYHITTQGSAYKKAMIEFHNEELVEGVPT